MSTAVESRPETAVETYRAVQAVEPGRLALAQLPQRTPGPGHVRVRVEACGVCHSDAVTVEALMPIDFPRVPGHEAVGRIDTVGDGVTGWAVGQRVGVGFLGGQCGHCARCRRGDFVNCLDQPVTGAHVDGGYAEVLIARETGLVAIPDELNSVEAAPLLCAGITTFNALRNSGARAGDLVAVLGIGGLGHLGVQYARRMGFRVVAIARGAEKEPLARELGAHEYIDGVARDPAAELSSLGGAQVILATASSAEAMSALIPGLAPRGELIAVGADAEPIRATTSDLIFGERSVAGRLTGSAADNDDTLAFSVLHGVRARIEVVPLAEAPAAYARMMSNQARFRMVLDTTR
ncbi:MAG TPA: alcohol dehydrogenase catalytic domain-containing protein [Solirubrobacteraceae bacterium]